MGNLHLVSTVLALLSYFSRRPGLMRLVGRLVSLATLVSLGLAGLAAGQRGNIWVVAGTGVMALAASWTRSGLSLHSSNEHGQYMLDCRCADENNPLNVDIINYLLMTSNVLYMKGKTLTEIFKQLKISFSPTGMITDPWNLPNIRSTFIKLLHR